MNISARRTVDGAPFRACDAMLDTQYALFRDLDRRCACGGLVESDCRDVVRLKRASIDAELARENPLAHDVLAQRTTFVAIYDSFSRGFRGVRRFLPLPHDPAHNERLTYLARVLPNVRHFTRRSMLATDNPISCAAYGVIASFGVGLVWAHSVREDTETVVPPSEVAEFTQIHLSFMMGLVGFLVGVLAMLRYRTRDPNVLHAREAAAYMDLNYAFYRTGNDDAWSDFMRSQCQASSMVVARPDGMN